MDTSGLVLRPAVITEEYRQLAERISRRVSHKTPETPEFEDFRASSGGTLVRQDAFSARPQALMELQATEFLFDPG